MINALTLFLMGVLAISEKDITQDYIFQHQGFWMHSSQQYVVHLEGCENGMCGTIVWIAQNAVKRDVNNKDETLRSRPLCGLRIVNGLATDGHVNIYKKGKMYRTDNGQTTSVRASYLSSQEVQIHSYQGVSMVGDSQMWARVSEKDYPPCTPVEPKVIPAAAMEEKEQSLSDFVSQIVTQSETAVENVTPSQPVLLTPQKPVVEAVAETPKVVFHQGGNTTKTKSNFKTKMIEGPEAIARPSSPSIDQKEEYKGPRTLTLEVVE